MLFLASGFDLSDPYIQIISASMIIVISYFYGVIAEKTNVPSVLMLIITGILIKEGLTAMHIEIPDVMGALQVLGTVGVIMIVMEAALDLELSKEKYPIIGKSILIALLCLLVSTFIIAVVFIYALKMPQITALIYATPLSIMSSAIIIPSIGGILKKKQEFMVYESAFSDILGIMFFYFLLSMQESGIGQASVSFIISLVVTLIISVIASYGLIYIFKDMKSHNKLFLLIAILLILYAAGKIFLHLYGALLIILFFGLALANHQMFFKVFRNDLEEGADDPIERIEKEFHLITLETAFVVRTFFFVVFGLTISLSSLFNVNVLLIALAVLAVLYIVRLLFLKIFLGDEVVPELYIAPRGLITVLLFYAIPQRVKDQVIVVAEGVTEKIGDVFDPGILLYVIIISSLIMTWALIKDSKKLRAAGIVVEKDAH